MKPLRLGARSWLRQLGPEGLLQVPRLPEGRPWGTIAPVGTPTRGVTRGSAGAWRRTPTGDGHLRPRWVLWGASVVACALGVGGALSLGDGPGIRVPPAVVLQSHPAAVSSTTRHIDMGMSPAPATGDAALTPVTPTGQARQEGVTVVTATPQVVVEPEDQKQTTDVTDGSSDVTRPGAASTPPQPGSQTGGGGTWTDQSKATGTPPSSTTPATVDN